MLLVRTLKFGPQNPARKEMGRKMVATAASRRLTLARCLLDSEACRASKGDAPLLDQDEAGHDLLQLIVDVFGV